MKKYVLSVLLLAGLFAIPGYCQDNQPPAETVGQPPAVIQPVQPQEMAIYGEVKTVNTAADSITVQYYDYDSDEEKIIEIAIDGTTKIENASTVNDIKQGNWTDVIYSVVDGKNIARSVIVEKEEEIPPVEMPSADASQEAPKAQ
ncbi:MAG: hypothetical protein PHS46_04650 [Candidatus Omnitrophica bacterium]|nr:hypothetical protein [Candidatus Omnitrophota bacterium]